MDAAAKDVQMTPIRGVCSVKLLCGGRAKCGGGAEAHGWRAWELSERTSSRSQHDAGAGAVLSSIRLEASDGASLDEGAGGLPCAAQFAPAAWRIQGSPGLSDQDQGSLNPKGSPRDGAGPRWCAASLSHITLCMGRRDLDLSHLSHLSHAGYTKYAAAIPTQVAFMTGEREVLPGSLLLASLSSSSATHLQPALVPTLPTPSIHQARCGSCSRQPALCPPALCRCLGTSPALMPPSKHSHLPPTGEHHLLCLAKQTFI